MATLQFMPWCHLDKEYRLGDIVLIPFQRDEPMPGLEALTAAWVRLILRSYRTISGLPVKHAVLVKFQHKDWLADLSDDEQQQSHELVQLATFAGLAKRRYFDEQGNYCNADCFEMYAQRFQGEPTRGCLITRRPAYPWFPSISLAELTRSMPVHILVGEVTLDEKLLTALIDHRNKLDPGDWGRWQNAITCFNRANTDNPSNLYQVAWVLFCSAFEHLLGAKSKGKDVARLFMEALCCKRELKAVNSLRDKNGWKDEGQPLVCEWMREFYRVRGDFAHGVLATKQPLCWHPDEHITLATIAFPLLVRSLLNKTVGYSFTNEDICQLNALERIADAAFLNPKCRGEIERLVGYWLLADERTKISRQKMITGMRASWVAEDRA